MLKIFQFILKFLINLDDIGDPKKIRKIKFYTRKDYEGLNPYKAIKYDKRSFLLLLHDKLIEDHPLYNLAFCDSIMEPLWFRLLCFFTYLNINFLMSALFFSDDYIDARSELPAAQRVSI